MSHTMAYLIGGSTPARQGPLLTGDIQTSIVPRGPLPGPRATSGSWKSPSSKQPCHPPPQAGSTVGQNPGPVMPGSAP